jgi:glycosyltransferase involved in cell wall biosynthesis
MSDQKINEVSVGDKPLVTFALFTYNQEKYIREAVEGALSQTYTPLEIIISDDCSSDRTFEIVQDLTHRYSGPHKLIINRNQENIGLAAHVNKVLSELVNGQWFVTAAGDDVSLPHRVEKTWATIVNNPDAKGVHCAVDRVNEAGVSLNIIRPRKKIDMSVVERESMLGAAAAYHRDVIDLYEPMDIHVQNEDMVLSLRALLTGTIVSFDDVCVLWRRHSNNMSGKINSSVIDQVKFLYCGYHRRRVFSSVQQLRDALAAEERHQGKNLDISELQIRLMKTITFSWSISRFSSYLFHKTPVPLSIKLNPMLWLYLLYAISKHYLSYYSRRALCRLRMSSK